MSALAEGHFVTPAVRLVRPLGEGGMGKVWLADHVILKTPVVVKFMSEELAARPDSTERFSLEATAASQMRSPHVVQVLDHGFTESRVPYIVMELLEGHDLRHVLDERGCMTPAEVGVVVAHVCKALSRAYKRGIVHRDIKPANIFLCDHGADEFFVKLLDFGIAKTLAPLSNATASGTVMGTVPYMSPEQLLGERTIDHRTDLWSLGVVVFEALTGTLPFEGETVGALTLSVHQSSTPLPSERCPSLGTAYDSWFLRACARAPEDRFASAAEMADAFRDTLALARVDMPSSGGPLDVEASGPVPIVPMETASAVPTTTIVDRSHVTLRSRPRTVLVMVAGSALVVAIGIILWIALRGPPTTEEVMARPTTPLVASGSAPVVPATSTPTAASSPAPPPPATMSVKATKPPAVAPSIKTHKPGGALRNDAGIY